MANTAEGIRNGASSIKGIHHVGLAVSNIDQQLAFFASAATLDNAQTMSFSGTQAPKPPHQSAVITGPNAYLELMQFEQGQAHTVPVEGPGFTHICFQSPAEFSFYDRFRDAEATAVSWGDSPVDLGGYGVHYAYLRDKDQTMFEVEQLDRPQFQGSVWIAHVALVSHDIDQLVAFYAQLFDIEPYRRVNKVTGPRADEVTGIRDVRSRAGWFNVANMVLEIWEYIHPVTPANTVNKSFDSAGYNKFAFEVSNIHSEVQRLRDLGALNISNIIDTPIGKEVYAQDPDGNRFSLVEVTDSQYSIDHLESITWQTT